MWEIHKNSSSLILFVNWQSFDSEPRLSLPYFSLFISFLVFFINQKRFYRLLLFVDNVISLIVCRTLWSAVDPSDVLVPWRRLVLWLNPSPLQEPCRAPSSLPVWGFSGLRRSLTTDLGVQHDGMKIDKNTPWSVSMFDWSRAPSLGEVSLERERLEEQAVILFFS